MIANFKARKQPESASAADWWKVAKDKTPAQLNTLYPPLQPREWYRATLSHALGSSRELELFGKNLTIKVHIDTEPDLPTREVHGHLLILKGRDILFETQVAERRDVSFVNGCAVWLKLPYDDDNPTHRTLRYAKDDELRVVFTVSKVVLADGTAKSFATKHPKADAEEKRRREEKAKDEAARKATEEAEAARKTTQEKAEADAEAEKAKAKQFVGRWRITTKDEGTFYFILDGSFKARKTNSGAKHGKWELAGNEARVTWDDGWRNILRLDKDTTSAFRPGTTWDDSPTIRAPAVKVRSAGVRPIKAGGGQVTGG